MIYWGWAEILVASPPCSAKVCHRSSLLVQYPAPINCLRSYEVDAYLSREYPEDIETYCSCPYGYNCKHGVAMLLALREQLRPPNRRTYENVRLAMDKRVRQNEMVFVTAWWPRAPWRKRSRNCSGARSSWRTPSTARARQAPAY